MNTKEILKKIEDNTISTDELKKFSKDKQDKEVVLEAMKNDIDSLKLADKKIIKWFESLSLWSRDQLLGLNKGKDPFGD